MPLFLVAAAALMVFVARLLTRRIKRPPHFHQRELRHTPDPFVAEPKTPPDLAERDRTFRLQPIFGADDLQLPVVKIVHGANDFFAQFAVADLGKGIGRRLVREVRYGSVRRLITGRERRIERRDLQSVALKLRKLLHA